MKTTKFTLIPVLLTKLMIFAALAFTACENVITKEVAVYPVIEISVYNKICAGGTADIFAEGGYLSINKVQGAFAEVFGARPESADQSRLNWLKYYPNIRFIFESNNSAYEGHKIDGLTIYCDVSDMQADELAGKYAGIDNAIPYMPIFNALLAQYYLLNPDDDLYLHYPCVF